MKKFTIATLTLVMVVLSTSLYASTAYMEFKVFEITDTAVFVKNSDGEGFWFSRPGFPIHEDQKVIIRSDLQYQGGTVWVWNPELTEFIGREEYIVSDDVVPSLICGAIMMVSLLVLVLAFKRSPALQKEELILPPPGKK